MAVGGLDPCGAARRPRGRYVSPGGTREIGPWGTGARLTVAAALLALASAGGLGDGLAVWEAAVGLAGVPVLTTLVHRAVARRVGAFQVTDGAAFCAAVATGVVLLSLAPTREIVSVFLGVSMIVAAVRGSAGCEVLAISNALLRRRDQVGCLLFSPIDAAERRLRGGVGDRGSWKGAGGDADVLDV